VGDERKIDPETRMLIDGKLVEAATGQSFIEPTVFTDVDNSMTIAQEEIFGPVLAVIPFEDDDDAVRIANDSTYGLGGAVFSGSHEHSLAVARRVRTGSLSIDGGVNYSADLPFGGFKHSGIGRQNGTNGFDQYLEVKSFAWPSTAAGAT
jgi:aldehyde dehydrogenase (NAD+)